MPALSRTADRLQRGLSGEPVASAELTELVRLAHALPPATRLVAGPSADFVGRLGAELRTEAARVASTSTATPPAERVPGSPAEQAPVPPARGPRVLHLGGRGVRTAVAGVAVAAIALGGLGAASRSALPGSLLYPVKGLLNKIEIGLAGSPYDTGKTYLAQASGNVHDAGSLTAADAPSGPIVVALTSAVGNVRSAQREFAVDRAQTSSDRGVRAMNDFVTQVLPQVDALRSSVPAAALGTWDQLAGLLRPYAAGAGQPGSGPAVTAPGDPTTRSAPTASPPSTGSAGPSLPVSPSSPGVVVSPSGSTVPVSPTGGTGTVNPTVGSTSPTVSKTVSVTPPPPPPSTTKPSTGPTTPAPFVAGDAVKILGGPVPALIGLHGIVITVDQHHETVTVKVQTPLGTSTVTLPYGDVLKL